MQLVVLASGNGSNFEAIVRAHESREIRSCVKLLIVDKKEAYAIKRAKKLGIRCETVELKNCKSKEEYENKIVSLIDEVKPNLICLAGYMKLVSSTFLKAYEGKIINIHPSLLPKYKGKRALLDALDNDEKEIGVSVHYVNEKLDDGEIIKQVAFNVEGLTLDEIEELLHKKEHELYISVIKEMEENYEKSFDKCSE